MFASSERFIPPDDSKTWKELHVINNSYNTIFLTKLYQELQKSNNIKTT